MITMETRAHLMAARDDLDRPGDGHGNVDLAQAAQHIDRALRALCPHLPVTWQATVDSQGRGKITCFACGMFWYDHEGDQIRSPYMTEREQAAYMVVLQARLTSRAREHGHAYVTPTEGERLRTYGLRQPGHTIHRFSTSTEDRSDAMLDASAGADAFENEGAPALALDDGRTTRR
jgi:hypothetical protein